MATGNNHYEQGATVLALAEAEDNWQVKGIYSQLALAHATLAAAAATAEAAQLPGYGQP